jgi:phage-related protein
MLRLVIKARDEASKVLRGVGKEGGVMGKALKAAQLGAAAGLAATTAIIAKGVKSYEDLGGAVSQLTRVTKISTEDASAFVGQWSRFGIDSATGTKSLVLMTKQVYAAQGGSKKSIAAFQALGISMADLKSMSPAEIMAKARDAMSSMGAGTQRTALMMQVFGKGGASMLKWLAATPSAIGEVNKTLADTGQIMSGKDLKAYQATAAAQAKLSLEWKGFLIQVGKSVLPMLGSLVGMLSKLMMAIMPLAPVLKYVAAGLAAFLVVGKVVTMIGAAANAMKIAAVASKVWAAAQWILNTAMSANPIGVIIVAIIALVAIFVVLWTKCSWFRDFWIGLWHGIEAVFSAAGRGIKTAAVAVFTWLVSAFKNWGKWILVALTGPIGLLVLELVKHWATIKADAVKAFKAVLSFLGGIGASIVSTIGDFGKLLWNAGGDLLRGLWNGMQATAGWLKDKLVGFFKNLLPGWAQKALGVNSPSRVFAEIGKYVPAGFAAGILGNLSPVSDAIGRMSTAGSISISRLPAPAVAGGGSVSPAPGGYGIASARGSSSAAAPSVTSEQHLHVHVHVPGGTTLVGTAKQVAEVLAPHVKTAVERHDARLGRRR